MKKQSKVGVSQKAIIFNDQGKVLTIRRSKTSPTRPFYWDLPGGILDFGENTNDAILREIKEETGLRVKNLSVIGAKSWHEGENFWVTICYVAKAITKNIVLSYEHDDFMWVMPREFQKLTALPSHKEFVRKFLSHFYGTKK